jgi:hypothetical protein
MREKKAFLIPQAVGAEKVKGKGNGGNVQDKFNFL